MTQAFVRGVASTLAFSLSLLAASGCETADKGNADAGLGGAGSQDDSMAPDGASGVTGGTFGVSQDGSGSSESGGGAGVGPDGSGGAGYGSGGVNAGEGSGGGGGGSTIIMPDNTFCAPVHSWPKSAAAVEQSLLELVNEQRAAGANCGSKGVFGAAKALTLSTHATCAARAHVFDMVDRWFVSHGTWDEAGPLCNTREDCSAGYFCDDRGVNKDTTMRCGAGPRNRLAEAGANPTYVGENIYRGKPNASDAVAWWMSSPGHCASIMNPHFTHLGGAYHADDELIPHLWTIVFSGN